MRLLCVAAVVATLALTAFAATARAQFSEKRPLLSKAAVAACRFSVWDSCLSVVEWIGVMKFTGYEAMSIQRLPKHNLLTGELFRIEAC